MIDRGTFNFMRQQSNYCLIGASWVVNLKHTGSSDFKNRQKLRFCIIFFEVPYNVKCSKKRFKRFGPIVFQQLGKTVVIVLVRCAMAACRPSLQTFQGRHTNEWLGPLSARTTPQKILSITISSFEGGLTHFLTAKHCGDFSS